MKKHNNHTKPCPSNGAVFCTEPCKCSRCGWNPDVAAARLERMKVTLSDGGKADEPEKG